MQEVKRCAVVAEREELGEEKSKLELKKMRAQAVLSKAVEEKEAAMARLRGENEQRLRQAREAEAVGQFKAADELKDQVTSGAHRNEHCPVKKRSFAMLWAQLPWSSGA